MSLKSRSQYAKSADLFSVMTVVLMLFATGCTKSRDAELPTEMQESVFAISDFGDTQTESSQFSIETDDSHSNLSLGNSSKATAEKGLVALSDVKVPSRLKYMFSGLEVTGLTSHNYPVTFSVDKQFVTAYKIVTNPSELTILEKQLAQVKEEVILQKQLQKNINSAKSKILLASLQKARAGKSNLLTQKSAILLVPLFKFKVNKFGVLQREKNKLKEDTSTLELKATDWTQATHIQIATTIESRLPVGLDPTQAGDLDRTFVMDRINNKIMTAETLNNEFQIPLGTLQGSARVLTVLDTKALHVFEVTQLGKAQLSDSQMRQLQAGSKSNVRSCSAEIKSTLPSDAQKDCILVLRYDAEISYVMPELAVVDHDGNQDAKVNFKTVLAGQNIGLVQIPKDVLPLKIESNNELDPNTTIRIADIKGKEFFFKRTLEDSAYSAATPGLAPGMAGAITIVKFDLEENRIAVRRADKLVNYKTTSNDSDYEELMSIPVRYLKLETKDASGAAYAIPRVVPATRTDAQYIDLDWTHNTIPQIYSPYSAVYEGCILGTANTQVADVDMRLDKGVLNFSQKYTVALQPECMADFAPANDYNGAPSSQYTARVTERISFKLNDGSTDKPFVAQVPFKVQNALGYGVWTIGQINPDINGQFGREGTETNLQMVHDFRNGKMLIYTLTGLPTDDPEMRNLYIGIAKELAASWNFAYKQAFKGSALERSGNYIEIQIAGENGVSAHLGDLDKNIFHFENKYASHGILGVSQVGFNPRSAIVVADSLILYTGNVKSDVSRSFVQMNLRAKWEKMKEGYRSEALKKIASQEKVAVAKAVTSQLINMASGKKMDAKVLRRATNLNLTSNDLKAAVKTRKALGGSGGFAYSSPKDESGWMDRVLQTMLDKPDMSISEIHGAIAKEVLVSKGNKLTDVQRQSLTQAVRQSRIRAKMLASLKTSPGCLKTEAEIANGNFVNKTFNEAFRLEALNTMVHEMGHSQGLTHNFIGSYDKANYANEDGTPSKRNYSSVMDYLTPGKFSWDGLGSYDIHAVRASQLGLLEVTPEFKAKLGADADKVLVNGKYITIGTIQKNIAKGSWANFTKANVAGVIKDYKYCTDIDVGWDPMCQRHDFGSTVTEVVESIKNDWEDNYISNYYSWDRDKFSLADAYEGPAWSNYHMMRMRKYMDETFYKLILKTGTQAEINDYVDASIKTYLFYTQLINTPDSNSKFLSPDRFVAVTYMKKELDAQGKPTGKETKDVAVVERRALQTISLDKGRVDTMGLEFDKIAAMKFLTLKGYPSYKYASQNIDFSFLDFEKYILDMTTDTSLFVNTLTGMMLNQLQPTFTNENVTLQPLPNEKATVTSAMRSRAGIYGILGLEASTLRDKDNFASLFKVGSSVGSAPNDRTVLSKLGISNTSKTRLGFWALDNATAAQTILAAAAQKNFFIQNTTEIQPLMEKLIMSQLNAELSRAASADKKTVAAAATTEVIKAKTALVAKLNALNIKGEIVSAEILKAQPKMSIENQVNSIGDFNVQIIQLSFALAFEAEGVDQVAEQMSAQSESLADVLPLFAIDQKSLLSALTAAGKQMSTTPGTEALAQLGQVTSQLVNASALETSYGIIMSNVEFLSLLTSITNPEYNR